MVEQDMPADWAIERACELTGESREYAEAIKRRPYIYNNSIAFARYIEAHEEAPVDPIEAEAQKIADDFRLNLSAMPKTELALQRALRRGMELAKEAGK